MPKQNKKATTENVKAGSTTDDSSKRTSGSTNSAQTSSKPLKPLTPFKVFTLCLDRAKNLLKIHKAAHGNRSRPEAYLSDAHRAAIVMSVSALDAYIRTFLIHKIRTAVADLGNPLPNELVIEIKKYVKEDALLEAARKNDLLDRVEKAIRSEFEKKSFQGVRNIEKALKLIGVSDIFHAIAISASVNEDTLKNDLDKFKSRRHIIAHAGDYDLSQNPTIENKVSKKDAEDCIKIISLIAKEINNLG